MSAEGGQFDSAPVDFGLENAGKISCVFILDPDGHSRSRWICIGTSGVLPKLVPGPKVVDGIPALYRYIPSPHLPVDWDRRLP